MPVARSDQTTRDHRDNTGAKHKAVNIDHLVPNICAIVLTGVHGAYRLSDLFFDEGYAKTQMFGLRWRAGSGSTRQPIAEH